MRGRPSGVAVHDLTRAISDGWSLRTETAEYAAVGGGSYHWVVGDDAGCRWFTTVDDLDRKPWLGRNRSATFEGLRAAMDTAAALRDRGGLRFVLAPVPTMSGETVRRLSSQYALTMFPFVEGTVGDFDEVPSEATRFEIVDMLAALHASTGAAEAARVWSMEIALREDLENALDSLGQPWTSGPFAEPARSLLQTHEAELRDEVATFARLVDRVSAAGGSLVVTHGEPHPGNVMRIAGRGSGLLLLDWDTVGLAVPERDLWMVATPNGRELRGYTEATGHDVDPVAIELYRRRWALDDTSYFLARLRRPHDGDPATDPDTDHAWHGLRVTIDGIVASAHAPSVLSC